MTWVTHCFAEADRLIRSDRFGQPFDLIQLATSASQIATDTIDRHRLSHRARKRIDRTLGHFARGLLKSIPLLDAVDDKAAITAAGGILTVVQLKTMLSSSGLPIRLRMNLGRRLTRLLYFWISDTHAEETGSEWHAFASAMICIVTLITETFSRAAAAARQAVFCLLLWLQLHIRRQRFTLPAWLARPPTGLETFPIPHAEPSIIPCKRRGPPFCLPVGA